MLSGSLRFTGLLLLVNVMTALAIAGGAFFVGLGLARWHDPQGWPLMAMGTVVALPLVVARSLVLLLIKIESNTARQYNELRDIQERLAKHESQLSEIAENVRISDAAKHITHRAEDRDALRKAIYDEVRREEWEAAFHLIEQMKTQFGYHEEADRLGEEVISARTEAMRNKMAQASVHIQKLFAEHAWGQAQREIERLRRALPDERRVTRLAEELAQGRQQRKEHLLKAWNDALRRNDLDEGINILKELDEHLTREEARKLEDSARGLFKEKLMQLGVQFKFAVGEKRWLDALEIGVQITEEFPNSRMAREVQEHLITLRQRAGLPLTAEVTAGSATLQADNPKPGSSTV